MINVETSKEELLQEAREYLIQQNTGFLASNGSKGLRVSPVSIFTNNDLEIFMHCHGGDKLVNISENSEVCLLVIEEKWSLEPGLYEGVQIFGEAKELSVGTDQYQQAEEWCTFTHEMNMTLIELKPKKMVVVNYIDGKKNKRALALDSKENEQ